MKQYQVMINSLEAGVILGWLERESNYKLLLSSLRAQLIDIKRKVEQQEGVKKRFLSDSTIELSDGVVRVVREPMDWEIEDLRRSGNAA